MKLFVLTLLLVAGVSSRPYLFKGYEAQNYGYNAHTKNSDELNEKDAKFMKRLGFFNYHPFWNQIKNFDDIELEAFVKELKSLSLNLNEELNINSRSYPTRDVKLVPGLGFVNTHSPLWAALEGMADEERNTFIQQLRKIKNRKKVTLVNNKIRARRDASELNGDKNADGNAEISEMEFSPDKFVIYISGVGFINPDSDMWSVLKNMTPEERDNYVRILIQSQKFNTEVKSDDEILPDTIVYVPGLGFVRKDSDLWRTVNTLKTDELASFFEEINNKYGGEALYHMGLVRSQEQMTPSSFQPDADIVSSQTTMSSEMKETPEEQIASYTEQLKQTEKEKEPVENAGARAKRAIIEVEEEVDVEDDYLNGIPKRVSWIPGYGFVEKDSELWRDVSKMSSKQLADFAKKSAAVEDPRSLAGGRGTAEKYTAVRAI